MKVAILGGGTIGRLVLEHVAEGKLSGIEVVALAGRSPQSRGRQLAERFGIPFTPDPVRLLDYKPDVIVESASHDAVRQHVAAYLRAGIDVIVMSGGALADDSLMRSLLDAAEAGGAVLWVLSGGIGGLDALKAAVQAGVEKVQITIRKPPVAWHGIPYVEQLNVDLEGMKEPTVLYEGPARAGVPLFPQNVNIAAALSLAGVGFDKTTMRVVADPGITRNTHTIDVEGYTGRFSITLENTPATDNPKTTWLACYSALAALASRVSRLRVGT